jgi:hypothetical protein
MVMVMSLSMSEIMFVRIHIHVQVHVHIHICRYVANYHYFPRACMALVVKAIDTTLRSLQELFTVGSPCQRSLSIYLIVALFVLIFECACLTVTCKLVNKYKAIID